MTATIYGTTAVCIAGKSRIAVEALKFAFDRGYQVLVCPVASDDGQDSFQPSLRKFAASQRIPSVKLEQCIDMQNLVFISLEYDRLINPIQFRSSNLFNIHFSLLPAYKGCFTSFWPLYHGREKTGVSLHRIDPGVDTGPIVAQREIPLDREVTARQLYEIYQDNALELFIQNLENMATGRCAAVAQGHDGSSYFSRQSLAQVSREIDLRATAEQIQNTVRAWFFPEYQTATYDGKPVASVHISRDQSQQPPGTVLRESETSASLATIDFDVTLNYFLNWTDAPTSRG